MRNYMTSTGALYVDEQDDEEVPIAKPRKKSKQQIERHREKMREKLRKIFESAQKARAVEKAPDSKRGQ